MKVLNAEVKTWGATWQPHHLNILVDKIPEWNSLVYDVLRHDDGSASYFHNESGYVSFFHHNPRDERGFGGREWTVKLRDGSTDTVKGPWSSNAAQMERLFGVLAVGVSLTDEPEVFKRGHTFYAAHVTEEIARTALAFAGTEWQLVQTGGIASNEMQASAEQIGIIYSGSSRGWYLAREHCPTAHLTEQYLWGREPRQRWATRAVEELNPALCIDAWHWDRKEVAASS